VVAEEEGPASFGVGSVCKDEQASSQQSVRTELRHYAFNRKSPKAVNLLKTKGRIGHFCPTKAVNLLKLKDLPKAVGIRSFARMTFRQFVAYRLRKRLSTMSKSGEPLGGVMSRA
jgi:hypothetical protein